jgi:hypothetical protein
LLRRIAPRNNVIARARKALGNQVENVLFGNSFMTEPIEILRAKLNGETAKVAWAELQRHHARGVVVRVDGELDLIEVALAMAQDDGVSVSRWMQAGQIGKVTDEEAHDWLARDPVLWSVVVAPWVLVQERTGN